LKQSLSVTAVSLSACAVATCLRSLSTSSCETIEDVEQTDDLAAGGDGKIVFAFKESASNYDLNMNLALGLRT
jgi:hypothetical protein